MGFSLTSTQVIFFIASVIVAGAVSGVFIAVTQDITSSFSQKGERVKEQLDIEFTIINDPNNIPSSGGNYLFYIKNIGAVKIPTTNETFNLFVDGEFVVIADYSFADTSIQTEQVTTLYISTSAISAGDHNLRVVGPQAISDEFAFKI
jgi:archaeal flagellar protein FlaG